MEPPAPSGGEAAAAADALHEVTNMLAERDRKIEGGHTHLALPPPPRITNYTSQPTTPHVCASASLAALTLALERKSDEHAAMHEQYQAMRAQMVELRAAALAKLGLPAEEAVPAAAAAAEEEQPVAGAAEAETAAPPPPAERLIRALRQPLPEPLAHALRRGGRSHAPQSGVRL